MRLPRQPTVAVLRGLLLFITFGVVALSMGCKQVRARRHVQLGNKAYGLGKYDDAVKHYESALNDAPELALAHYNLAVAHLAMFQKHLKTPENNLHAAKAVKALQTYLSLIPKDSDQGAVDILLTTYIDSGNYQEALRHFENRLAENPNDMNALAQLAKINAQAGKFDESIQWHKKRAELETSVDARADAWYAIGTIQWRRLNKHPEIAGMDRLRIADSGLYALQQAELVRKDHPDTIVYTNLLYRERAELHDVGFARAVEAVTAQAFQKRAEALKKGTKPTPEKPEPKKPEEPKQK